MTDPNDRTQLSDTHTAGAADDSHADEAYCSACNQSFSLDIAVCPNDGARLVKLKATRDVLLGRVFDGRYEVLAALGQGGMGTVYRAHQISVDREVAIKVIHPKLASDRIAVKRFLREARLASRLSQPNIVNVYDFGQTDDGILYLVMELLRGHTLARELEAMRPVPVRRVSNIALQLCDALEVAHAQGIVHRDLKPSNVVVLDEPPGRDLIKVLDFGLAKSLASESTSLTTNSNAMVGTPMYMPPEQIEGAPSDQRADLYAFGCILYHLLSGKPPFQRDNVNMVLAAHMHDPVPPLPPSVPASLATTVLQLMAKRPAERPSSSARVRAVLQALVETGFGDANDTIPVPSAFGRDASSTDPIALAMTDPQGARPTTPVPVEVPRRAPRGLLLAVVVIVPLAAAAWFVFGRSHGAASTPVVKVDAAPVALPMIDAAPLVPAIDAAVVPAAPLDAAPAVRPPPVQHRPHEHAGPGSAAAQPPPPPPAATDAGMPTIDLLPAH